MKKDDTDNDEMRESTPKGMMFVPTIVVSIFIIMLGAIVAAYFNVSINNQNQEREIQKTISKDIKEISNGQARLEEKTENNEEKIDRIDRRVTRLESN